ncbi:MAG: 5-methylthioadenosine/S-adenosylhomocysteine deaminase [Verrucomicrobiales bacterium]|jgi:5-methylthioadenosine/S-adenosylhomocysteine deaminase
MTTESLAESSGPSAATRLVADLVVPAEGRGRVIRDGAIDIAVDGRIVAVGAEAELGESGGVVRRVGGLLMPGLVNTHAHSPMTIVRSTGDGLPLDRWLAEGVWPREGRMTSDDARWGMTLGSIEMLRAGVTTTVETYLFEDQVLAGVQATGQRAFIGAGIISAFMPDAAQFENRVVAVSDFIDAHHEPGGLVHVGYGPHSTYDLDPGRLADVAAAAKERDAIVTIHLEETQAERALVRERYGRSATQILADAGVLDGPTLMAHGVWLDDADRSLLGSAGAAVAHCPQSNGKLGSGIADVVAMLNAGITVGIGTDGPASNDDLDLWEELRLAPILARAVSADPEALSSVIALDLATRQGAQAIGMDDVGELRPGAWADILRVDIDHPEFVIGHADDVLSNIVWAGSSKRVTNVWVAGVEVVVDGECVSADRHEAQHEVRARARRVATG